jgi:hypothetical protein
LEKPFHPLAAHQDFGGALQDRLDAVGLAETLRG